MIGVAIVTFAWVMMVMAFYASREEGYRKGVVIADPHEPPHPEGQGSFLAGWFPGNSQTRLEPQRDWTFLARGRWWLRVAALTIVLLAFDRVLDVLWHS
jgi:hypothetical protein